MSDERQTQTHTDALATHCIECLMTWLLKGDGGICLLCQAPVYWIGKKGG